MKTTLLLFLSALPTLAQDASEKRTAADQPKQEYFLIDHSGGEVPKAGYKLLLVLPGGDGSASFNPFVTNMGKHAAGEDYLVAQLVSVKWTPEQKVIWPTERSKVPGMKFTTEEFAAAVIAELKEEKKIDEEHVYSLSWSSGGPAAYAISMDLKEVRGSFVAMSVFKPGGLPELSKAKGHRYYIYHSPDDKVCPFRMAEEAREALKAEKAEVEFASYEGGHGWHGDIFGALRKGLRWLESR